MRRVKDLPRHAVDDHSYHPLVVCSCGGCENKDQIACQGKPYITKFRLDCKFHALLYERECHARAKQQRGHSNAVESSHNVFFRFRSKDIGHFSRKTALSCFHKPCLAILPTCMQSLVLVTHWILDLYRRMKLPVFDGVQAALEKHHVQRKRKLEREKTTR